jgi:hypothetical protein
MSDTPETHIQPRLVRHLLEGGALRRFSADGPNDARDNFHDLRWNGYRFDVRGLGSALLTGDGCLIAAMYHPEEWEILPNSVIPKHMGIACKVWEDEATLHPLTHCPDCREFRGHGHECKSEPPQPPARNCRECCGQGQVEIQSGPYMRECAECNGTGKQTNQPNA